MRGIRIGICVANAARLSLLTRLIRQVRAVAGADLVPYTEPEWLISDVVRREQAFDVLLIQRELGRHSGASIAKEVLRLNPRSRIVLLSEENRVDADDYEIGEFSLLPMEHVALRMVTVLEQAARFHEKAGERYMLAVVRREKLLLPCSEILYLERIQRKTAVVLPGETVETYQTPQELLESGGTGSFVQCHRSIWVNMDRVFRFGQTRVILQGGTELPVGAMYAQSAEARWEERCRELLSPPRRDPPLL